MMHVPDEKSYGWPVLTLRQQSLGSGNLALCWFHHARTLILEAGLRSGKRT